MVKLTVATIYSCLYYKYTAIIMNDACTINVSLPYLVLSIMIVNLMLQFGASLTDDSRIVIYNTGHRSMDNKTICACLGSLGIAT
jgi:hypothetical protein